MPLPDRARIDLVVVLCGLVTLNAATAFVLDSWPEVAVQVLGAATAVGYAMWRGYSRDELGLGRDAVGSGLRVGAALGAIILLGVTVLALVPFSRDFLDDDRFDDLPTWEALYEIVVRIPFVTALTEELLFRSVLLAVLLALTTTKWAVVWSSVVFGLWHVFTTLNGLDGNDATASFDGWAAAGSVVAVVIATGIAGVIFAWSRLRSASVVAPWIVHIAFNSSTFTAGVLLAR